MKRTVTCVILSVLFFALLVTVFNLWYSNLCDSRQTRQNVTANHINSELEAALPKAAASVASLAEECFPLWRERYGEDCPADVSIILLDGGGQTFFAASGCNTALLGVYGEDGQLLCFVEYLFNDSGEDEVRVLMNVIFALCFALAAGFYCYIYVRILRPFKRLCDFPERIARLETNEKLPESKNKYFGRYIWGINMLSDAVYSGKNQLRTLEHQRQTLLSSIAHGVKTPVANIRLYSAAIREGLYSEGAVTDTDKELADKIENNAIKIEKLTKELLETASSAVSDYTPEIGAFYLRELADMFEREYGEKLRVKRIPFTLTCAGNPLLESDKWALLRVLSQLTENAVKYGDGTGICVNMFRQDDGFILSVKNKGSLLPQQELAYIFRSFWRGSNAAEAEGNGIGLYVAAEIVKKLGGGICARRLEDTSEMEFVISL